MSGETDEGTGRGDAHNGSSGWQEKTGDGVNLTDVVKAETVRENATIEGAAQLL